MAIQKFYIKKEVYMPTIEKGFRRSICIAIKFNPIPGSDLHVESMLRTRHLQIIENCILCMVDDTLDDAAALEKVREYLTTDRGLTGEDFEIRLGHNHRKPDPHAADEKILFVTDAGCTLSDFQPS